MVIIILIRGRPKKRTSQGKEDKEDEEAQSRPGATPKTPKLILEGGSQSKRSRRKELPV